MATVAQLQQRAALLRGSEPEASPSAASLLQLVANAGKEERAECERLRGELSACQAQLLKETEARAAAEGRCAAMEEQLSELHARLAEAVARPVEVAGANVQVPAMQLPAFPEFPAIPAPVVQLPQRTTPTVRVEVQRDSADRILGLKLIPEE